MLINSTGLLNGFRKDFHSEKKGSKNAKATEVIGKYKTFQKNGFCSIVKLNGIIPNIKKNKIPKPINANKLLNLIQIPE